jgi:class 3 adenylate cyclase/pimeloyl-ACP methyl ester carboxylesterase
MHVEVAFVGGHGRVDSGLVDVPDPKYVKTDDGSYIAYQVVGDGPVDIAWQFDFWGNIDVWWEAGLDRYWFESLARMGRLILHDRRATGLSSRNVAAPNLETRVADLRAVLDEVGSEAAVLGGWYESMAPCLLLAASDPERIRALVWWWPVPRTLWSHDFPWGMRPEELDAERESLKHWGTLDHALVWADQFTRDNGVRPSDGEIRHIAKLSRQTCTPDVALEISKIWWDTDIRPVLPAIQTPTLLIINEGSQTADVGGYVESLMPNAKLCSLPGGGFPASAAEIERWCRPALEEIQRFVGIEPPPTGLDTILSTILFTDIVGSTEHQAQLGDRAWKDLVQRHHGIVRTALGDWRGVENDTAGDGFYATFDGPARAIHCAHQVSNRVRELAIEIRAGIHTGECELIDGKCGGIAVTTGARIASLAGPSQVLVSQTVKDLVAGSGFTFKTFGEHHLKGIPNSWRLYVAS